MIYYLAKYVLEPIQGFEWFRLLSYVSFRCILSAITAFGLIILFGNRTIRWLYLKGARDTIHNYGILDQESKRGTPTMGGVMLIGSLFISILLWNDLANPFVHWITAAMLWFGGIGFFDDYQKIKHQDSRMGLSQKKKLALQTLFAVLFMAAFLSDRFSPLSADRVRLIQGLSAVEPEQFKFLLQVPFRKYPVADMSWLYLPFGVFIILSISNSVNFSDGLDGLAIVPATLTAGVYGLFAYIIGNSILAGTLLFTHIVGSAELSIILSALVGAGLGFLWFNTYPAQVFMGDIGALAVGAALGTIAVIVRQ